jgi:hypothetical protein
MPVNLQTRQLGLTHVRQSFPFGLYTRTGHRLLCADGQVRAAVLASTADTFFSVPASVRLQGRTLSGYMTVEEAGEARAYAFRHHTQHNDLLPGWPARFTPEHDKLVGSVATTQFNESKAKGAA